MSAEDPETRELRRVQAERHAKERERAVAAPDPDEAAQHKRRAEKAQYLRDKLEERAESEREAGSERENASEPEAGSDGERDASDAQRENASDEPTG